MMNDKVVVLSQSWGGLGDNLQFSTLPELYSKLGYKVYISKKNAYRNKEIYDLVWGLNPYVEGVSDMEPNIGECRGVADITYDFIKNVELKNGLTNGYRKYPVIYYKPKLIQELSNCLLYDLTSITMYPKDTPIKLSFESIFNKYPELSIKKLVFEAIPNRNIPSFQHDTYIIKSIYDLCDAIYSCKVFLCLRSGASVLASAIKGDGSSPEIYTFHDPWYNNQISYTFKNNNHLEFVKEESPTKYVYLGIPYNR